MRTLTLKISDELDTALRVASTRQQIGKSEFVRQALGTALENELRETEAASRWLARWSARFVLANENVLDDAHLKRLLRKHLK
jgi:predicted transcriptional regulator